MFRADKNLLQKNYNKIDFCTVEMFVVSCFCFILAISNEQISREVYLSAFFLQFYNFKGAGSEQTLQKATKYNP